MDAPFSLGRIAACSREEAAASARRSRLAEDRFVCSQPFQFTVTGEYARSLLSVTSCPGDEAGYERAASAPAACADGGRRPVRESAHTGLRGDRRERRADIILDPLGGAIFEAAVRALAWRGRLVVIGFAAGAIPTIRTNYLLLKIKLLAECR